MARTEARILASIWKDQAFRAYDRDAQHLYLFLLSQPDLAYSGVISLRVNRWSRASAGLTADEVRCSLKALAEPFPEGFGEPFLVVDEDTEEVLIRSFIRNDELWKQPNLIKAARSAAEHIESPRILAALLEDLQRIPFEESSSALVRNLMTEFIEDLERACANPSPDPSPNPSGNPSQERGVGNGSSEGDSFLLSPSSDLPTPANASRRGVARADARLDVERLCKHLADRIEGNGSKRPVINKRWRDAARLMIDNDGRTEQQIHAAIDWCQDSDFWAPNVMSMSKLRTQYDVLRQQAQRKPRPTVAASHQQESDDMFDRAMQRALAREGNQ